LKLQDGTFPSIPITYNYKNTVNHVLDVVFTIVPKDKPYSQLRFQYVLEVSLPLSLYSLNVDASNLAIADTGKSVIKVLLKKQTSRAIRRIQYEQSPAPPAIVANMNLDNGKTFFTVLEPTRNNELFKRLEVHHLP